jgi:preprotein translocase subunit SecG
MVIVINILLAIHVLVSLLLILLVLMQRPKSEGLGAAFGGGMTDNLFGAQGTNVLQTITRWLGAIFFVLSLTLSILYVKKQGADREHSLQRLLNAPVPAVTPEADAQQKIQEAIQKAVEQQKNNPATTTDPVPAPPEGTTPPAKPGEPVPAPAAPAPAGPAPAAPASDAKAPVPAPAAPEPAAK